MIAKFFKQIPRETMKTGVIVGLAAIGAVNVFPVLRQWDVFAAFPSDAYRERESILNYDSMDGIVYSIYQDGEEPRREMSKYSKGKMIIG